MLLILLGINMCDAGKFAAAAAAIVDRRDFTTISGGVVLSTDVMYRSVSPFAS
jgi:hypothetical protein